MASNASGSLRWLLSPTTPRTFVDAHLDRGSLHVRRSDTYYDDLLRVADLDDALSRLRLAVPQVRLAQGGCLLPERDFTLDGSVIDPVLVAQRFEAGATIVFDGAEHWHPKLAEACSVLSREVRGAAWANLYLTPGRAQGFAAHADNHDVFVLQIAGTKAWSLYAPPPEIPALGASFTEGMDFGQPVRTLQLSPGDLLYIPRGHGHSAAAENAYTLHATIGITPPSWADLVAAGVRELATSDPRFRATLAFGTPGASASAGDTFQALLASLTNTNVFENALSKLASEATLTRRPLVPGQLLSALSRRPLTLETCVGVRPALAHHVSRRGMKISLDLPGRAVELPRHAEGALRFALTNDRFHVRDLPGLDDEGKLTLARRLMREGVLRVHRAGGRNPRES